MGRRQKRGKQRFSCCDVKLVFSSKQEAKCMHCGSKWKWDVVGEGEPRRVK